MKSIKKFSAMTAKDQPITESAKVTKEAVDELIKKIGFDSIEELKKEKDLLSKLEAMSKTIAKSNDISEDEIEEDRAEDIEDEMNAKGKAKSLEGTEDKEGDAEVVDSDSEVAEDEVKELSGKAKEIEDEVNAIGDTKSLEDKEGEEVSDEQEITAEVPAEADEVEDEDGVDVASEEEETPKATRRIMAFEDFIKEKEETINKNISYHDDDEEPEDYAVPVAASADPLAEAKVNEDDEEEGKDDEKKGDELEDKGDKKVDSEDDKEKADHYKGAVKSDDSEIDALKKDVEYDEEEEKKDESRIMSFSNFVTESYEDVEEEEIEAEEEEAVEEAVGEVITKVEGDEIADEEAGDDGLAIPAEKGDGSETAAGIAGDIMDMGKVKVQPESKGEELVTKDQNITTEVKGEADDLNDATEVPAEMGDGSESAAGIAGDIMNMGKVKVQPESKGEALVGEAKINEKDITSADEFKEYAMAILKDAFGDDFDETKATETAEGLLKKYGEDYGAMVGALQSTMGS